MLKDTASNILETEVFTVSMVSHRLVTPMVQTSLPEGPEVSEFRANGLEAVEGIWSTPPPAEALAAMECRLVHAHDMQSTHLLVGEVLRYHIDDAILRTDERGMRWSTSRVWTRSDDSGATTTAVSRMSSRPRLEVANQQFPALVEAQLQHQAAEAFGDRDPRRLRGPRLGGNGERDGAGVDGPGVHTFARVEGRCAVDDGDLGSFRCQDHQLPRTDLVGPVQHGNEAKRSPATKATPSSRPVPPRVGLSATQEAGVFDVLGEGSQEVRTEGAIHDAVVAGERHAHSPAHGAVDDDGYLTIPPTAKMQASGDSGWP